LWCSNGVDIHGPGEWLGQLTITAESKKKKYSPLPLSGPPCLPAKEAGPGNSV